MRICGGAGGRRPGLLGGRGLSDGVPHRLPGAAQCRRLAALDRLPDTLRIPVVLRYFTGLPGRDIATAIRRRPGTVKSRLAEARRRLALDPELAEWAGVDASAVAGEAL